MKDPTSIGIGASAEERVAFLQVGDDGAQLRFTDERHLSVLNDRLALEFGGHMSLAEQTLGPLFTKRDVGRAFAVDPQDQSVAEIGTELHRHDSGIGTLCRKN